MSEYQTIPFFWFPIKPRTCYNISIVLRSDKQVVSYSNNENFDFETYFCQEQVQNYCYSLSSKIKRVNMLLIKMAIYYGLKLLRSFKAPYLLLLFYPAFFSKFSLNFIYFGINFQKGHAKGKQIIRHVKHFPKIKHRIILNFSKLDRKILNSFF